MNSQMHLMDFITIQKILAEENDKLQKSYIALLVLTKEVLETCIDMLGFSAPDRM